MMAQKKKRAVMSSEHDRFNPTLCISGLLAAIITLVILKTPEITVQLHSFIGLFGAAFLTLNLSSFLSRPQPIRVAAIIVQIVAYVGVCLTTPHFMSAILLVVLAGQLPFVFSMRLAVMMLLGVNLAAFTVHTTFYDLNWLNVLVGNLLYVAFQLFSLAVSRNVVQEQLARAALEIKNAELAATQTMLEQSVRLSERLQLSRDLHDICGHQLTALTLNLEFLSHQATSPVKEGILETKQVAKELLAEIRKVVRAQRSQMDIDLKRVLTELIERISSRHITFNCDLADHAIPDLTAEAMFRVAQEGLTNALKHSQSDVNVTLNIDENALVLTIRNTLQGKVRSQGVGLKSMSERMQAVKGMFNVTQEAGEWVLVARAPV